jgi:hypothetical protein
MSSGAGAAAGALGSLGSGAIGKGAANSAGKQAQQGAMLAMLLGQQMFPWGVAQMQPFQLYGIDKMQQLDKALPGLLQRRALPGATRATNLPGLASGTNVSGPFNPTMKDLQNTPGYQWALDQGLKSTQNSYAARGLGSSGAAMKGAAEYAQGLASNTYQQQFQNYWANQNNMFNQYWSNANNKFNQQNQNFANYWTQGNNMFNQQQALMNMDWGQRMNIFNMLNTGVGQGMNASNAIMGFGNNILASMTGSAQNYGNAGAAATNAGGAALGNAVGGLGSWLYQPGGLSTKKS